VDRGPSNALSKRGQRSGQYSALLEDIASVDFKVRITQAGTEAVFYRATRVHHRQQRRGRATAGPRRGACQANIVDASFAGAVLGRDPREADPRGGAVKG